MRIRILCAVTALAGGMAVAADHPGFSGTYMLDAGQSSGDVPEWSAMTVAQKGHWFKMAQNDKNGREVRSFEGECKTDGRFHPVQGGNGGSISCKWDGTTLVTREHWNNDQNEREVRTTMGADGKLVQDISGKGADARNVHLVWSRQ